MYGVSKLCEATYSRVLAQQLGPQHIDVNACCPGLPGPSAVPYTSLLPASAWVAPLKSDQNKYQVLLIMSLT